MPQIPGAETHRQRIACGSQGRAVVIKKAVQQRQSDGNNAAAQQSAQDLTTGRLTG